MHTYIYTKYTHAYVYILPVKSRQSRRKTSEIEQQNTEDELRPFLLEEEVRNLKNSLQNERRRTSRLMKVIEQRMQRRLI